MTSTQTLTMKFAGLSCRIDGDPQSIAYIHKAYAKSPFSAFVSKGKKPTPDAVLTIVTKKTQARLDVFRLESDPRRNRYTLICSDNVFFLFPVIEQVLRKIFYILFFKHQGIIMHASAVAFGDKTLIFAGPSGAGKSTIMSILKEDPVFQPFADNNVYIKKTGSGFRVYRSPFLEWNVHYSQPVNPQQSLALFQVCILRKGTENRLRPASMQEIITAIGRQIQIPPTSLSRQEQDLSKKLIFEFITTGIASQMSILTFQKKASIRTYLKKFLKTAS